MVDTVLDANLPSNTFAPTPLPLRAGVGLKAEHVATILETKADIGFFEVHAENYMGAGGQPHAQLRDIRERYPISLGLQMYNTLEGSWINHLLAASVVALSPLVLLFLFAQRFLVKGLLLTGDKG